MTKSTTSQPINQARRNDRAIDDPQWIRALLHRAPFCTIATTEAEQPFTMTNLFTYDEAENALFLHTAHEGRFRRNIEGNPRVCFTVMEMGRLLPADRAMNFSVEYASVVVFGRASVIDDPEAAACALQKLMDKYAPHLKPDVDYETTSAHDLKVTAVYRIDIETWSGKQKKVADDFPNAYRFEDVVQRE